MISVTKNENTVGHLPRKLSQMCTLFLRRGGTKHCIIMGGRRYSRDLPQGGVKIPCKLLFQGKPKEIKKVVKLSRNGKRCT